jgi:hypothetical protein
MAMNPAFLTWNENNRILFYLRATINGDSEITNRFKRTIADDEVGIGFISNNIIWK